MAAVAGIAAFFVALFLSFQLFPDPGTGNMGYAIWRFIFTIVATSAVSIAANNVSKNRRQERERHEAELKREQELAKGEATQKLIQEELDREEIRRSVAVAEARNRVGTLRALLHRREQQQRDSGHRQGRFAFGVVSDELLADIVWEKLQTPEDERTRITAEQMELLRGELSVGTDRNQRSELNLEGMQYATNIDALRLHPIDDRVDLSPIAGLTNLRRLEIRGGKGISNIDALATLVGLEDLALAHLANVLDFRPLAGLERLMRLELTSLSDGLEFDSVSGITGIVKLEVGHMRGLTSVTGISHMQQLRELILYSTGSLDDLSPLTKLSRLEHLLLNQIHIRDLTPVGNLETLKSLVLRDVSGIAHLEALSRLGQIESIELTGVRLDSYKYEPGSLDLGPLGKLSTLRKAKLVQGDGYTSFTNWDALSRIKGLVELEASGDLDELNATSAISHLERLETLRISSAILPSLEPLSVLSRLERLEILGKWVGDGPTRLRDLRTLVGLPRLQTLIIDTCEGWRLLREIGQFRFLTRLELRNCTFSHDYEDLKPLEDLTRLQTLVLRENSNLMRDLSPLDHLPRLTSLTIVAKHYESPWDTSRFDHKPALTISTR